MNDTHPVIAAIELLRQLLDIELLGYDQAWYVVTNTFAYTNHTVLPEALEKWSVNMI
jgi:glycogen phosphorylase